MKKYIMLLGVLVLAACSDTNEKATWVAQNIPNEEQQPAPTYAAEVDVYSPNVTTKGQVIKRKGREKWILVNAQDVAAHPNALVHHELLTLGEVEAVDEVNNIALIRIRNSYDYEVNELVPFVTMKAGEHVTATVAQIESLLQQAIDEPIDWATRYEKNSALREGLERADQENFTTFYSKNTFTYNSDELMAVATRFIEAFNTALESKNQTQMVSMIGSDDIIQEIQYVNEPIRGFTIKGARKDGVYYFVNGVDENKEEIRLTFIREQETYRVIGLNFIAEEVLKDQKVVTLDLSKPQTLAEVPALHMFVNGQMAAIKFKTSELTWQLTRKDKKIAVKKDGKDSYSCTEVEITDNELVLASCGPQNAIVPLVKFK